jgi:hypothetical protein
MATTEIPVTEDIKDFSVERKPIKFKIDDDIFEAVPDVAAEVMIRFIDQASILENAEAPTNEKMNVIQGMFYMVLKKESADTFVARLNDPDRPISLNTFVEVVQWIMEQYSLRPTEPDSES